MDPKTISIAHEIVDLFANSAVPDISVNQMELKLNHQISELFSALCSSYQSAHIFKLSKTDEFDYYFCMKINPDEAHEYLSSIEVIEPVGVDAYKVDTEKIETPQFDKLMDDMKNVSRSYKALLQKNEDLIRSQSEAKIQMLALTNQATMETQLVNCSELIKKLSTDSFNHN